MFQDEVLNVKLNNKVEVLDAIKIPTSVYGYVGTIR